MIDNFLENSRKILIESLDIFVYNNLSYEVKLCKNPFICYAHRPDLQHK